MNPKVAAGLIVSAVVGAAAVAVLSSPSTIPFTCEMGLPDGGSVAMKVVVPAKTNPLTACVDAAVAEKLRRDKAAAQ